MRRSPLSAVLLSSVFVVALAGCAAPEPPRADDDARSPALAALEHVHELAFRGEELLLASHRGVYAVDLGTGALSLVGETAFDAMGMAVASDRLLVSGHPANQVDDVFVAPNIGLASYLPEEGWTSVALAGETDFHALAAAGALVVGLPSDRPAVALSDDGGVTWRDGAALEARDLVLVGDPARILATTAEGVMVSDDGGETFAAFDTAPRLVVATADRAGEQGVLGISADGAIVRGAIDGEEGWQTIGQSSGAPVAIASSADGETIALMDDRGVVISSDGGQSWRVLVS